MKPEALYYEMIGIMESICTRMKDEQPFSVQEIKPQIERVVDAVEDNPVELIRLTHYYTPDNYLISHSVNVCLLSVAVGLELGYAREDLLELAEAALLYDLGILKVFEITQKKGRLDFKEFERVKRHPLYGLDLLQKVDDLSLSSLLVAKEHHEREDGSGYPMGIENGEIQDFARIIGLVEVFEALTHPRIYRDPLSYEDAIKVLRQRKGLFQPRVLNALLKRIPAYPAF